MQDSEELKRFLEEYGRYVKDVLQPTREDIRRLFKTWSEPGYWGRYSPASRLPSPSPVHRTHQRIKRPESVVDKILRQPAHFPDKLSLGSVIRMTDAIGARVIVFFLAHLPFIDHDLRSSELLEVSTDPQLTPVAYLHGNLAERLGLREIRIAEKESGYASLHYFLRFRDSEVPVDKRPWFELQVRTMTEHVWAEIEHTLGYKPNKRTSFAVRKQFQVLSSELAAIDEHFNLIFEELSRFQQEGVFKDDDPLNAENLPPVLHELGVGCDQKEIDGLLKLLVSRGIHSVGALREVGSTSRIEIIRNTYRTHEGRAPINFDVVASLAAIRGLTSADAIGAAVRAQIEFLKAWENLKKDP